MSSDDKSILVVVIGFFAISVPWVFLNHLSYKRYVRECAEQREQKEAEGEQARLKFFADHTFGIKLEEVHLPSSLNEIERLVNLSALQVARACVNQDKGLRSSSLSAGDLTLKVQNAKRDWAEMRDLALEIAPELKNRLPHFSEFEPLKSYRTEHLEKKGK